MKAYKKFPKRVRSPSMKLWNCLPKAWQERICFQIRNELKAQYSESPKQIEGRVHSFVKKEVRICFLGAVSFLLLVVIGVIYSLFYHPAVVVERNPFGQGEKEVIVHVKDGKEEKDIAWIVGEQQLSASELDEIYATFFEKLGEQMRGANPSLSKVKQPLDLEESLSGYPFEISYEISEPDWILSDGSFGEAMEAIEAMGQKQVVIRAEAIYGMYSRSYDYVVILHPVKQTQKDTVFARVEQYLNAFEHKTRAERVLSVPYSYENAILSGTEGANPWLSLAIVVSVLCIFLVIHDCSALKENSDKVRKETVKDFPEIVYLFTLYMGAGLSFASLAHQISADYKNGAYGEKRRYAYDQIVLLSQQMKVGVSQKEACIQWGSRFREGMYQKLAILMVQSFAKGSKEANLMMQSAQKDAFRQYVDQIHREGEEASTKLLFPMLVLMGVVFIIVMFPAFLQFGSI